MPETNQATTIIGTLMATLSTIVGWLWMRLNGRVDAAHKDIGAMQQELARMAGSQEATAKQISRLADVIIRLHERVDAVLAREPGKRTRKGDR